MGLGEAAGLKGGGHGECVEVVDVGGGLEVRGFLLRRGGLVGGLAVEDGVEGFGGSFLGGGQGFFGVGFTGVEGFGGSFAYGWFCCWRSFFFVFRWCIFFRRGFTGFLIFLFRRWRFHFFLDRAGQGLITSKVVGYWGL